MQDRQPQSRNRLSVPQHIAGLCPAQKYHCTLSHTLFDTEPLRSRKVISMFLKRMGDPGQHAGTADLR